MQEVSQLCVALSLSCDLWNRVACDLMRAYFKSSDGFQSFLNTKTEPALRLLQLAVPRPGEEPVEPIPEELLRIFNTEPDPDDTVEFLNPLMIGAARSRNHWHAKILRGYDLPAETRDEVLDEAVKGSASLKIAVHTIVRRMEILQTSLDPAPELHQRGDGASLLSVRTDAPRWCTLQLRKKNDKQTCIKEILALDFDFSQDPVPRNELLPVWQFLQINADALKPRYGRSIDGVAMSIRVDQANGDSGL